MICVHDFPCGEALVKSQSWRSVIWALHITALTRSIKVMYTLMLILNDLKSKPQIIIIIIITTVINSVPFTIRTPVDYSVCVKLG